MRRFLTALVLPAIVLVLVLPMPALSDGARSHPPLSEEVWALPLPLPMMAYVIRPAGPGPHTLVIMNHGESLDPVARSFFPRAEFRAAALWFARQGYFVIAPIRPGFGSSATTDPEQGLFGLYFGDVGECANPNFRDPGIAIAVVNEWIAEHMVRRGFAASGKVVAVGQSGGGWGAIALSSRNPSSVKAIIAFAAGRGGRAGGKPNNNCAPEKLIGAASQFGRTARTPSLWIYTENDSYFGPDLSRRMHAAYQAAGGNAEYHLLPSFGEDGHFFFDSVNAIPTWSPLVSEFLERQLK